MEIEQRAGRPARSRTDAGTTLPVVPSEARGLAGRGDTLSPVASQKLLDTCARHGVLAIHLFGSRAEEGLDLLAGGSAERAGSDLDVGVVFAGPNPDHRRLASLQVALEAVFEPLRVDLVPVQRVDALFQFAVIEGHRVMVTDSRRADLFELHAMRRAAELLPIQRRIERELFGVTTR